MSEANQVEESEPLRPSDSAREGTAAAVVGVVAIGRNEGERLRRCLESVAGKVADIVYVDSGSSDDSVATGRAMGVHVIVLDTSVPFTAARARNAGFDRLLEVNPEIEFVQFVDGDCEIAEGWIEAALAEISQHPDVAVVCGFRRERFADRSIYNRLMDMDWNSPVGETKACGGDALIRVHPFRQVGGYNPRMIAGEDPELCVRLRGEGKRILRIDSDMTFHDSAMLRFSQWWRRATRGGYAYALGAALHGRTPERHGVRESLSIVFWGAMLPLASVGLAWPSQGWSLLLLLLYPIGIVHMAARRRRERGDPAAQARLYACYCMLGKFPQVLGASKLWWHRLRRCSSELIEYK